MHCSAFRDVHTKTSIIIYLILIKLIQSMGSLNIYMETETDKILLWSLSGNIGMF